MLIHLINGAVTGIDCNLFSYKIIKNKKGNLEIIDVIPENINDYKLILQYIVEHLINQYQIIMKTNKFFSFYHFHPIFKL
jgi:hypothetical protein